MMLRPLLTALVLIGMLSTQALAGPPAEHTLEPTLVYQAPANLANGGKLEIVRSRLRLSGSLFRRPGTLGFWNLSIGHTHYETRSAPPATQMPWRDIYHAGAGITLIRKLSREWGLLVSPSIDADGEAQVEVAKALQYGLFTALTWQRDRENRLGFGAVAAHGLEESRIFPVLIVNWRLNEQWRIANPLRAGVTGPAGLELSYTNQDSWEFGLGGAWRTIRFRLDDSSAAAGGIGEERLVPLWLRASHDFEAFRLTIFTGMSLQGEVTLEDRDGRKIRTDDYGEAPFVACYLSGKF